MTGWQPRKKTQMTRWLSRKNSDDEVTIKKKLRWRGGYQKNLRWWGKRQEKTRMTKWLSRKNSDDEVAIKKKLGWRSDYQEKTQMTKWLSRKNSDDEVVIKKKLGWRSGYQKNLRWRGDYEEVTHSMLLISPCLVWHFVESLSQFELLQSYQLVHLTKNLTICYVLSSLCYDV
jgi:hypothetical protein